MSVGAVYPLCSIALSRLESRFSSLKDTINLRPPLRGRHNEMKNELGGSYGTRKFITRFAETARSTVPRYVANQEASDETTRRKVRNVSSFCCGCGSFLGVVFFCLSFLLCRFVCL